MPRMTDATRIPTMSAEIQRSILPIPEVKHVGLTTYDAKDPATRFTPIRDVRPPDGAPNVLVILIDDCGFGASSAFGGPVNTPTAERLASGRVKLNRFHTTALCSPSRASLMTGLRPSTTGIYGMIPDNEIRSDNEATKDIIFLHESFNHASEIVLGKGLIKHD